MGLAAAPGAYRVGLAAAPGAYRVGLAAAPGAYRVLVNAEPWDKPAPDIKAELTGRLRTSCLLWLLRSRGTSDLPVNGGRWPVPDVHAGRSPTAKPLTSEERRAAYVEAYCSAGTTGPASRRSSLSDKGRP